MVVFMKQILMHHLTKASSNLFIIYLWLQKSSSLYVQPTSSYLELADIQQQESSTANAYESAHFNRSHKRYYSTGDCLDSDNVKDSAAKGGVVVAGYVVPTSVASNDDSKLQDSGSHNTSLDSSLDILKTADADTLRKALISLSESLSKKKKDALLSQLSEYIKPAAKPLQNSKTPKKMRKSSGLSAKDLMFSRQWNEEYQSTVEAGIENLSADNVKKISRLVRDFVHNAESYAKVIINELNVPFER